MTGPLVRVTETVDEAAETAAALVVSNIVARGTVLGHEDAGEFHLAVSGGSVATSVVPAIVAAGTSAGVDWSRVHVWFADERFVPRGHPDRTAVPIAAALREAPGFDAANLHATLSAELGVSLDECADAYDADLRRLVPPSHDGDTPALDLVLLGAGPDGHTASLFPDHDGLQPDSDRAVIAVRDSPKPPPERVSLTLSAIRAAQTVTAVVTGEAKAEAVAMALRPGVDATRSPLGASLVGPARTLILDAAARGH